MAFNPLREKGIPLDKQFKNWDELNTKPYDKDRVHPYTRARIILMNSIEATAALFLHEFARHTGDLDLKRMLGLARRVEQQQQKTVNWMIPGNESDLELTLGYEQTAVDATAYLAQIEPDIYFKQTFDFSLLDDFDHLYRFANYLKVAEGKDAAPITKQYTEITVGRPTALQHRHPFDDVVYNSNVQAHMPASLLHLYTIIALEQQAMNFYMNIGNRPKDKLGRALYIEIAQMKEQHVSRYESLTDPHLSWYGMFLLHEFNECWLYYSFIHDETDPAVRSVWEQHLMIEIEHLRVASRLVERYDGRDPAELLPAKMTHLFKFRSNIDYIREILTSQIDLTADGTILVPIDELPGDHLYLSYQEQVNANGSPSETVVDALILKTGNDYRYEIIGPHPVNMYRRQEAVAAVRKRIPRRT